MQKDTEEIGASLTEINDLYGIRPTPGPDDKPYYYRIGAYYGDNTKLTVYPPQTQVVTWEDPTGMIHRQTFNYVVSRDDYGRKDNKQKPVLDIEQLRREIMQTMQQNNPQPDAELGLDTILGQLELDGGVIDLKEFSFTKESNTPLNGCIHSLFYAASRKISYTIPPALLNHPMLGKLLDKLPKSKQVITGSFGASTQIEGEKVQFGTRAIIEKARNLVKGARRLDRLAQEEAMGHIEEHEQDCEDMAEKIAGRISQSTAISLADALKLCTTNMKVADRREEMKKFYFCPDNMTGTAISLVLASLPVAGDPVLKAYNLPSQTEVSALAEKLGFDSTQDFVEDVKIGCKQYETAKLSGRTTRNVINRSKAEEFIEEINLYRKGKGSKLEPLLAITNDPEEDSVNIDNINEELEAIVKDKESKHTYYPFKFSAEYCYCVLYYHYFYKYGYLLPFGKTEPELPWVYIFSLLIDAHDTLNLKLSPDKLAFKIGGLGTIENIVNSEREGISSYKDLFSPILGSGLDISKFKNILGSAFINIMKMQGLCISIAELMNSISLTSNCTSNNNKALRRLAISNRVDENPAIKQLLTTSQMAVDAVFGVLNEKSTILSILGVTPATNRYYLSDALSPLRPDIVHLCTTMSAQYLSRANNSNAVSWFKSTLIRGACSISNTMSYFLKLVDQSESRKILEKNFESPEMLKEILAYITTVKNEIKHESEGKMIKAPTNPYLHAQLHYEWSDKLAKVVLLREPEIALTFEKLMSEMNVSSPTPLPGSHIGKRPANLDNSFSLPSHQVQTLVQQPTRPAKHGRLKRTAGVSRCIAQLVSDDPLDPETVSDALPDSNFTNVLQKAKLAIRGKKTTIEKRKLLNSISFGLAKGLEHALKRHTRLQGAIQNQTIELLDGAATDCCKRFVEAAIYILEHSSSEYVQSVVESLRNIVNFIEQHVI